MEGRGKTLLVTGATGFIGRRCVLTALDAGFTVHAVSSRARPEQAPAGVIWHQADLLDVAAVKRLLEHVRTSHLLHLAWIAKPGAFWTSRENFAWLECGNILFRTFFEHGGQRAVGVGTCAEYAPTEQDCKEDGTPLRPDTVYGRCKLEMSRALGDAAAASGRSAAWARLFFPYGPGEPSERFIPTVIRGLLKHGPVDCTHGNQVRDFIFVDDVAAALVKMLTSTARGAFNVGTGRALSLREVVAIIGAKLGHVELVRFGARPAPPGEPSRVVADVSRLRNELRWEPVYGVEAGIDLAIAAWRGLAAVERKCDRR